MPPHDDSAFNSPQFLGWEFLFKAQFSDGGGLLVSVDGQKNGDWLFSNSQFHCLPDAGTEGSKSAFENCERFLRGDLFKNFQKLDIVPEADYSDDSYGFFPEDEDEVLPMIDEFTFYSFGIESVQELLTELEKSVLFDGRPKSQSHWKFLPAEEGDEVRFISALRMGLARTYGWVIMDEDRGLIHRVKYAKSDSGLPVTTISTFRVVPQEYGHPHFVPYQYEVPTSELISANFHQ